MRSRVLAVAFACLAVASHPARAEETPPNPYSPPPHMQYDGPVVGPAPAVPGDINAAIDALRRACAAWPLAAPLDRASVANAPGPLLTFPMLDSRPQRGVCDAAMDPERAALLLAMEGGCFGATLTVAALVAFCWLRGVLVNLWARRPTHLARRGF